MSSSSLHLQVLVNNPLHLYQPKCLLLTPLLKTKSAMRVACVNYYQKRQAYNLIYLKPHLSRISLMKIGVTIPYTPEIDADIALTSIATFDASSVPIGRG
ncbi:hypothetical protein VNO77_42085 [Canavalia gladiata]|uniref:Uncharacterized protein n=1 Tax=Canavalia gladiata TaxID=3824 RepID=A0AAN9PT31_CANGL